MKQQRKKEKTTIDTWVNETTEEEGKDNYRYMGEKEKKKQRKKENDKYRHRDTWVNETTEEERERKL